MPESYEKLDEKLRGFYPRSPNDPEGRGKPHHHHDRREDRPPAMRSLPPLPNEDNERAFASPATPKEELKGMLKGSAGAAIDKLVEKVDTCVGKELDNQSIDGLAGLAQMNNFKKLAETNPTLLKKYGLNREHLAAVDRVTANEKLKGAFGAMVTGPGGLNTEAMKELKDAVSPEDWKRLGEFEVAAQKMGESVLGCVIGEKGKDVKGAPHERTAAPHRVHPIQQDTPANGRREL